MTRKLYYLFFHNILFVVNIFLNFSGRTSRLNSYSPAEKNIDNHNGSKYDCSDDG